MRFISHFLSAQFSLFILFSLIYVAVCFPALGGGFVLDDLPNLEGLGYISSFSDFLTYTFTGISSTLGRPLSHFSFGLQYSSWPSDPASFRAVNLVLHIVNGCIVYGVCVYLARYLSLNAKRAAWFALVVSVFWLFLPLHASTVFYVVQRMTILAATFTLLGILGFVMMLAPCAARVRPVFIGTAAVMLGYIGGVLSKEAGVLLAAFLLLIFSFTTSNQRRVFPHLTTWVVLFGWVPIVLLLLYLLVGGHYQAGYSIRDFTVVERLMTQPSVLISYLSKIIAPSSAAINIYNDGFGVVRDPGEPAFWGSLISICVIGGCAYSIRKQVPAIWFGVCWFLVGHSLESSFLGLELYFEHRNYLPSVGIVIACAGGGFYLLDYFKRTELKQGWWGVPTVLVIALLNIVVLRLEANSWSGPREIALAGISDRPDSLRAWQQAAAYFANVQDYEQSALLLSGISQKWPNLASTEISKLLINCYDDRVAVTPISVLVSRFTLMPFDRGVDTQMRQLYDVKKRGACEQLSWKEYRKVIGAFLENENFVGGVEGNLIVLLSYSFNAQENYEKAAKSLEYADANNGGLGLLILKAKFNAMAGDYTKALEVLEFARLEFGGSNRSWIARRSEVEAMKVQINVAIEQAKSK